MSDSYADDAYVDDAYVDDAYVDDAYVDAPYADAPYGDDTYADDPYGGGSYGRGTSGRGTSGTERAGRRRPAGRAPGGRGPSGRGASTSHGRGTSMASGQVTLMVLAAITAVVIVIAFLVYASGSGKRVANTYLGFAVSADQALTSSSASYTANQHRNLTAAESALKQGAQALAAFDSELAAVAFPNSAQAVATVLITDDEKQAKLFRLQAQAPSLKRMRSFNSADQADVTAIRVQVARIRQALGLPPASGGLF